MMLLDLISISEWFHKLILVYLMIGDVASQPYKDCFVTHFQLQISSRMIYGRCKIFGF